MLLKTKLLRGKGKKRIKITKQLVEKTEKPRETVQRILEHQEVEMTQLEKMRAAVLEGDVVTLRARLGGGYLKFGNLEPYRKSSSRKTNDGGTAGNKREQSLMQNVNALVDFAREKVGGASSENLAEDGGEGGAGAPFRPSRKKSGKVSTRSSKKSGKLSGASSHSKPFLLDRAGTNSSSSDDSSETSESSSDDSSYSSDSSYTQPASRMTNTAQEPQSKHAYLLSGGGRALEGVEVNWRLEPIIFSNFFSNSTEYEGGQRCFQYGDVVQLKAEVSLDGKPLKDPSLAVDTKTQSLVLAYDTEEKAFCGLTLEEEAEMLASGTHEKFVTSFSILPENEFGDEAGELLRMGDTLRLGLVPAGRDGPAGRSAIMNVRDDDKVLAVKRGAGAQCHAGPRTAPNGQVTTATMEGLFTIDHGGFALFAGMPLMLRAVATGNPLRCTDEGDVFCGPLADRTCADEKNARGKKTRLTVGGAVAAAKTSRTAVLQRPTEHAKTATQLDSTAWGYWLIDRVIDDELSATPLGAAPCDPKTIPLKIGDKVALQGLNEKYLKLNTWNDDLHLRF